MFFMVALKSKFCAKCGGNSDKLIDNLCSECFLDLHKIKVPKQKEFKLCSKCGAISIARFWVNSNKENKEVFAEQVKHSISVPDKVKVIEVDLIKIKPDGLMEVTYKLGDTVLSKQYKLSLRVQKQICPTCKIKLSTDHKAVIQFRAKSHFKEFIAETLEFASKYKAHIIKIKEYRTGIDVFVKTLPTVMKMSHDFRQKHSCHMKETREEYGWDGHRSKPKYKSTILLTKK
jgi:nonsense-mediated mRNA decay protein 3